MSLSFGEAMRRLTQDVGLKVANVNWTPGTYCFLGMDRVIQCRDNNKNPAAVGPYSPHYDDITGAWKVVK